MPATPSMTLAEARAQLQNWMKALEICSTGQSYSIAGRSLNRQDVPTIRGEIQRWHNTVLAIEAAHEGKCRPLGSTASFAAPGGGGVGVGIIGAADWSDWRS